MGLYEERALFSWLGRHPGALGTVLGILGVLFVVVGVLGLSSDSRDAAAVGELRADPANIVEATLVGSVVEITEKSGALSDETAYCPEYAYTAPDGVERTVVDRESCAASKKPLTVQTIRVVVDPDHPTTVFIDDPEARPSSIFSWAMLVLGIGLVVATPFVVVRGVRKRAGVAAA